MIIDAHVHCSGQENTTDTLKAFDEAGVEIAVLLAPFLSEGFSFHDRESLRRGNEHLARLVKGHEDRLVGFAVVNPGLEGAPEDLRYAIEELGLRGLKTVPSGWYPYDECAHRVFEVANEAKLPVLFHSGIFIDGKSGRYCRPTFFEAVREHPDLRVTLAHLGWPWTDESNAVGVIDLINGKHPDKCQFRFDISWGAPPVYRHEVLHKALAVLTPGLLQFGSDRFLPCSGAHIKSAINELNRLLDEQEIDAEGRERMFCGTAAAWLGLSK